MTTKKKPVSARSTRSAAARAADAPELTDEQKLIRDTTKATSKIEAGGVVRKDFRDETEGVKTPIKSDFDAPESPMHYDPPGMIVGPKDPGKVTIGPGETAAQHEAHVLLSGAPVIAERLEKEEGPDGLPTDEIAREQQVRAAKLEFQRVDGTQEADRGDAEG